MDRKQFFCVCMLLFFSGCQEGRKLMTPPSSITHAKIIRAGAELNDSNTLEKNEFLILMQQVSPEEADQIEIILFGKDVPNTKDDRMQAFRASYFINGYTLSQLADKNLRKDDVKMVTEYTSKALNRNKFAFVPGSSITDPINQDIFTDQMVTSGHLYLCLGHGQEDPKINGVEVIHLPEPSSTKDGLRYIPGSALNKRNCIIYVPKPWFGAGSQHKGFYPHDYSVTLNMLIELASTGDTEFLDMIGYSFDNFKALAESIGHIPNANKSWSIGYTSRSQTNTLVSQVLLYADYLKTAKSEEKAISWLKTVGVPIAESNLAFLTAARAKTPEGLYVFVPIGKIPEGDNGDIYIYTAEMHNSPILHNFYFERLLTDLINTYEESKTQPNFCRTNDCLKYIEEVTDSKVLKRLKLRNMRKLFEEGRNKLSPSNLASRENFVKEMEGLIFVWDHPVRGEELLVKSPKSGKYYRLTNYALGSDQAMRASGFDPSDMANINSLDALDTAYVGHNCQLYRQMLDMSKIHNLLGNTESAEILAEKATQLKQAIFKYMWSNSEGEFLPYHTNRGQINYRFFDMSYSLWAGLFDVKNPEERGGLMSLIRNISDFEGPEGPYASTDWSGHNWGWGKVWPVMTAYAVMGLRDYSSSLRKDGFKREADLCEETAQRIALKWLYSNAEMFAKNYGFGENLAVRPDGKPLENIYGYSIDPAIAGNYTWHVVITRWLYSQLNNTSKSLFNTYYSALKTNYPDKL